MTATTLLVQSAGPQRDLFIQQLRQRGHILHVFSKTADVLANWPDSECILVIIDLVSLGQQGLELCREIRHRPEGGWSVMVVLTASHQSEDVEEAIRSGADDYLVLQDEAMLHLRLAVIEHRFHDRLGRREMMHDLTRAEIKLREFLETAPDAIIGVDQEGIIQMLNERVVTMTGYSRAELLGQPIELLVPKPFRQGHVALRENYLAHPITRSLGSALHLELEQKNGNCIPVDICLGYFRDEGKLYVIAAVRDITERRRMEEQIRLAKETAERALNQIQHDLQLAAQMQRALLPTHMPAVPGAEWALEFAPSAQLAGDGLNVFQLDHRHWGMYLLDVSGHGVAAALLSVSLSRLLSSIPHQFFAWLASDDQVAPPQMIPPSHVAKRVNQWFLANPSMDQFFSMIYAIYDAATRQLTYVSAGHPGMIHLTSRGETQVGGSTGPVIGLMEEPEFAEEVISLSSGDRLFFYTDGVTEAFHPSGELFGLERLKEAILKTRDEPIKLALDHILLEVKQWSHGPLADDVSLLALAVK